MCCKELNITKCNHKCDGRIWYYAVQLLSPVRLFATPWTVAHQVPPSMGFPRQEYWSGLPLSSPTASTMLNQSDESKHSYPIPGFRGKALSFSPLSMILALDFSYVSFIMLL